MASDSLQVNHKSHIMVESMSVSQKHNSDCQNLLFDN